MFFSIVRKKRGAVGDLLLVGKGNLGIRDQGGRKKRVCCPAFGTFHPADPKPDCPGGKLYTAPVVAMDGQTEWEQEQARLSRGELLE